MRLQAAADALHHFLQRSSDSDFEEFLELVKSIPRTNKHDIEGTEESLSVKSTASRRASLSFAVDRLLSGVDKQTRPHQERPTFAVIETRNDPSDTDLDSRCHAGSWGLSGTEALAASVARSRSRSEEKVRLQVVQVMSSSMYHRGVQLNEYRYPADWAAPPKFDPGEAGFASAQD